MQVPVGTPVRAMPLGALELREAARESMARAVVAGSAIWVAIFLLFLAASPFLIRHSGRVIGPSITIFDFPSLPSAKRVEPPPESPISRPKFQPSSAVPVPVPDVPPPPDAAVSTPAMPGAATGEPSVGDATGIELPAADESLPGPNDVAFVDEYPVPITMVKPEYPELAREAGVEGTVTVRALVGKDGRVREAFAEASRSVALLDGAAIDAVKHWVFKPALTHNQPVPVWVSIPMRFTLH